MEIDMTKAEEIMDNIARLNSQTWKDREEVRTKIGRLLSELKKALEQQPSDDCVSRKAVLDEINSMSNANPSYWNHCDVVDREDLIDGIQSLPPVIPTQSWIPVSEKLPKKNMPCLVSVGDFNLTQIAIYSDLMHTIDHKIFWQGDYGHENFRDITKYVRAWQPLPKPYEEKRGGENGSN